jgi:glucose/arabinose dehydrogenase
MTRFCLIVASLIPLCLQAQSSLTLTDWASGFTRPLDIAHCGDSRLFIVQQNGVIRVLDSTGTHLDTFLNIDPRVNSTSNEQGLLGLVFHPDYAQNGYFFVNYSTNGDGSTQISRFTVKPDNPDQADPGSELPILNIPQPFANHNGGCLKFGNDGYMYIGMGDGGSGGDPLNNSQTPGTLLGKILRIDIANASVSSPYSVPPDNPFVGQAGYQPEIWSLGWRNPWRFSFDRLTGDMWVGDVGQNAREEIDFIHPGEGGLNYGWRCYEGEVPFNTAGCQSEASYAEPFFTYPNPAAGCSVTGGFVYRGSIHPDMYGMYVFADFCNGKIWGIRPQVTPVRAIQLADISNYQISTFGEDAQGELYLALLGQGRIQKLTNLCLQPTLALSDSILCMDEPLTLTAGNLTPGTEVKWYRDNELVTSILATDFNWSITVPAPASGLYRVEIPDSTCTLTSISRFADMEIGLGPVVFQSGDTLFSGLPCPHCQWIQNGNPIPGANGDFYVPTATGTYWLEFVSDRGCIYKSVAVDIVVSETVMPEEVEKFTVSPNPTDGIARLELVLKHDEPYMVSMTDALNRQLFMQTHDTARLSLPIDLRALPAGTYLLKVELPGALVTRKIVKR